MEATVPYPESSEYPSRSPSAEKSTEDQPFYTQKCVDITGGKFWLSAAQADDLKDLSKRTAGAANSAVICCEQAIQCLNRPMFN